jgi:hypothetical protein
VQLTPEWEAAPLPIHLIYPPARFYPARLRRFIDIMRIAVPQAFGIQSPAWTEPRPDADLLTVRGRP